MTDPHPVFSLRKMSTDLKNLGKTTGFCSKTLHKHDIYKYKYIYIIYIYKYICNIYIYIYIYIHTYIYINLNYI